jgi:transposase InsO family protein
MADEQQRTYLFVAIDRATRWLYLERLREKSAKTARGFLERLLTAAPFKITIVPTDNGKEFNERCCATGERRRTGRHPLDRLGTEHAIEHRLLKPGRPRTHGMVERFNGGIAEVLTPTRFRCCEHLNDTLQPYATLQSPYPATQPQPCQPRASRHRVAPKATGSVPNRSWQSAGF